VDAKRATPAVLVIHGPNLNLLGEREPAVYGSTTLGQIDDQIKALGRELGLAVETFQSNSEGAIVDRIQAARGRIDVLIINPAAYTHTSVAIRDAILNRVQCIEVQFVERL
jgi:3-dehydroquinate dehydratase-2